MKKIIQIFICCALAIPFTICAQTAHFENKSLGIQTSGTGGKTLKFYFRAYYHGNALTADSVFHGTISVFYATGKKASPAMAMDSISSKTVTVRNNDSILISDSIQINSDYFRNGSNNIIVIWPTGARSGGGVIVGSIDSLHYNKGITITGLVGISPEDPDFNPVRIYPNPAANILTLELKDPAVKISGLKILDINGKTLINQTGTRSRIDLSLLSPGTYFLELSTADKRNAIYRFIVVK
jgi:hypothetical protein